MPFAIIPPIWVAGCQKKMLNFALYINNNEATAYEKDFTYNHGLRPRSDGLKGQRGD